MSTLQDYAFLRLPQIIGDKTAKPPVPALIPISRSAWWAGVASGRFPKQIKLSPRISVWKSEDIKNLIEKTCEAG